MTAITENIQGGDYGSGGRASKKVKEVLKRIGVEPAIVRRAMVAAYEAEMNVVIHADAGVLHANIGDDMLDVAIEDKGPGIADIETALKEGYSTAPAKARELGFGAGMGLPNIRRNTDRFSIHSEPGVGTRLRFALCLRSQNETAANAIAVRIDAQRCIQCLRCLHVCPTRAIRIRNGTPCILSHLCVDCTACMSVCPENVYSLDCATTLPEPGPKALLLLPPSLRGQFGSPVSVSAITDILQQWGWNNVRFLDQWELSVESAASQYLDSHTPNRPLLSPVCPAIINLIRTRYPSLLSHIAPYLTAMESALESLSDWECIVIAVCPAQCGLAKETGAAGISDVRAPQALLARLARAISPRQDMDAASAGSEDSDTDVLRICGMERVCQFLDEMENGRVNDCNIVALYACDLGCFGAPVWWEHPAVALYRKMHTAPPVRDATGRAVYRAKPLSGRSGLRLDPDMRNAMAKLARIDQLTKELPGRDCGACGAPACMALAEDIVLGRADMDYCIFKNKHGSDETRPPDKES